MRYMARETYSERKKPVAFIVIHNASAATTLKVKIITHAKNVSLGVMAQ